MLKAWIAENRLVLNVNKYKVVNFNRKDKVTCPPEYTIMGQVLEKVKEYIYLGIMLDHQHRWNKHVQRLSLKTNRNIGFIFRNLKRAGQGTKVLAYRTISRSGGTA
jgi:hypothetical protein